MNTHRTPPTVLACHATYRPNYSVGARIAASQGLYSDPSPDVTWWDELNSDLPGRYACERAVGLK